MDWIHCNVCCVQPGELPKRQYNLTSCGHIFCAFCEKPGEISECKVCKSKCTTTQIAGQMPHDVQMYFEDPDTTMGKIIKVIEFQRGHRTRLMESRRIMGVKYQKAKAEIMRLQQDICAIQRKLDWYMKKNGTKESENREPRTSTSFLSQSTQTSQNVSDKGRNTSYYNNEHMFRTPNTSGNSDSSGYRSTGPRFDLDTPSDISTPASILSDRSTPCSQPFNQSYMMRSPFRSTPPLLNMKQLTVSKHKPRLYKIKIFQRCWIPSKWCRGRGVTSQQHRQLATRGLRD